MLYIILYINLLFNYINNITVKIFLRKVKGKNMKKKAKFKKDIMAVLHNVLVNQMLIMSALSSVKEFEHCKNALEQYHVNTGDTIKINIDPWLSWNGESND